MARQHGASILLRIDDLDRQRARREYIDDIFDTLRFTGIPWDEGPADTDTFVRSWSQSHRMPMYHQALVHLQRTGAVFACSCSRSGLARTAPDGVYPGTCLSADLSLQDPDLAWRMVTVSDKRIKVRYPDGAVADTVLPADMRHVVVRKRGGDPSYQLASLMDDIHFGVDLVVRGEDLRPSTLVQLHLSDSLPGNAFPDTAFLHHALLLDPAGEKLSKSEGATSVRYLRAQGLSAGEVWARVSMAAGLGSVLDWQGLFEAYQHRSGDTVS
jgi:glutamyl/glutaminyl-tRNA synthetase